MPRSSFAVGQTVLPSNGRARVRVWYPAAPLLARSQRLRRDWAGVRYRLWGGGADSAPRDVPLAPGTERFPMLVYFSGWPGTDVDNVALIAGLAAQGFVIAALSYSDRTPMDHSSETTHRRTVQLAGERVRARARDGVAVLDDVQRHFAGRVDPCSAGIFGFSFGGAIAAEAAALDARLRAVVNIDGRHWGTALEGGVAVPYLFIGEALNMPGPAELLSTDAGRRNNAVLDRYDYSQLAANLRRHGGMQVVIRGTLHMNFCDAALRTGRRRRAGLGSISPRRALLILNAHVIAFFQRNLARSDDERRTPVPRFAEAHVEQWPAPQAAGGIHT